MLRLRASFGGSPGRPHEYLPVDSGRPRDDVMRAFPDQLRALNSGYVVLGAFAHEVLAEALTLECFLTDGSVIERAIPSSIVSACSNQKTEETTKSAARKRGSFFSPRLPLLRAGMFRQLLDRTVSKFANVPASALERTSDLGAALLRQDERDQVCVIVDHDLGGGANHYRDRLVDSVIDAGRSVILMTYDVSTLSHMLIVRNRRLNRRCSIPDTASLLDAIKGLCVSEIVYNTAVSFARPDEIPKLLVRLKMLTGAQLKVLAHDFYLVCPSHFLLDSKGEYCYIPDLGTCSNCLPKNQQGFASLFVERDMAKWRELWGALLAAADEIVAFSNSTAQLLMKAYPQIEASRISITPHRLGHLGDAVVKVEQKSPLCIGVVGQIGFHKGAAFIQALAREIKDRDAGLKIVVIGSIEVSCEPSVVSQTGAYQHDEMSGLIEASGANVMLFPSIWPETFSYVVQELMALQLPVASFNFGAPAERLAGYEKGLVLTSMEPASVLDQLIAFHGKIYLEQ